MQSTNNTNASILVPVTTSSPALPTAGANSSRSSIENTLPLPRNPIRSFTVLRPSMLTPTKTTTCISIPASQCQFSDLKHKSSTTAKFPNMKAKPVAYVGDKQKMSVGSCFIQASGNTPTSHAATVSSEKSVSFVHVIQQSPVASDSMHGGEQQAVSAKLSSPHGKKRRRNGVNVLNHQSPFFDTKPQLPGKPDTILHVLPTSVSKVCHEHRQPNSSRSKAMELHVPMVRVFPPCNRAQTLLSFNDKTKQLKTKPKIKILDFQFGDTGLCALGAAASAAVEPLMSTVGPQPAVVNSGLQGSAKHASAPSLQVDKACSNLKPKDLKLNADMCSLDSDQALCTEMNTIGGATCKQLEPLAATSTSLAASLFPSPIQPGISGQLSLQLDSTFPEVLQLNTFQSGHENSPLHPANTQQHSRDLKSCEISLDGSDTSDQSLPLVQLCSLPLSPKQSTILDRALDVTPPVEPHTCTSSIMDNFMPSFYNIPSPVLPSYSNHCCFEKDGKICGSPVDHSISRRLCHLHHSKVATVKQFLGLDPPGIGPASTANVIPHVQPFSTDAIQVIQPFSYNEQSLESSSKYDRDSAYTSGDLCLMANSASTDVKMCIEILSDKSPIEPEPENLCLESSGVSGDQNKLKGMDYRLVSSRDVQNRNHSAFSHYSNKMWGTDDELKQRQGLLLLSLEEVRKQIPLQSEKVTAQMQLVQKLSKQLEMEGKLLETLQQSEATLHTRYMELSEEYQSVLTKRVSILSQTHQSSTLK